MTVASMLKVKGREVLTVAPEETISQAAEVLAERRIGALLVADPGGKLVGILSERDVVRAVARHGADAFAHPVSRHMTAKVETARETDRVTEIMERMTAGKFRHMPVLENGRIIGVVSIGDVVKHRLAEMEAETRALKDYITA